MAATSREGRRVGLSPGRYHSFTVRIWSQGESGEVTHGQVVNVATHQTADFRDLRSMITFMLRSLKNPEGDGLDPSADED